ncbi:MAG: EAL domain-containing protein, partial [Planctomycetota bacterium]
MSEPTRKVPEDKELQIFVGRQSILDKQMSIYGYELLFRSGLDNVFSHIDGDEATSTVISNSFFNLGFSNITQGKKATVNFTRNVLIGNYAQLLPKEILVVEILEDVEPDHEVLDAVRHLKSEGYYIALDDYQGDKLQHPLLDYVDMIKVDFSLSPPEKQHEFVKQFQPRGIEMLAEKVETREEFTNAVSMGYTLFQGYFFCKP